MDKDPLPKMNANEMERRCNLMMERLWKDADTLLVNAAEKFREIVNDKLDRDYIHTQRVTDAILEAFGQKRPGA